MIRDYRLLQVAQALVLLDRQHHDRGLAPSRHPLTRNTKAAKRFLGKTLRGCKEWELPEVVNTDKAPTYAAAIAEAGRCGCDSDPRRHAP